MLSGQQPGYGRRAPTEHGDIALDGTGGTSTLVSATNDAADRLRRRPPSLKGLLRELDNIDPVDIQVRRAGAIRAADTFTLWTRREEGSSRIFPAMEIPWWEAPDVEVADPGSRRGRLTRHRRAQPDRSRAANSANHQCLRVSLVTWNCYGDADDDTLVGASRQRSGVEGRTGNDILTGNAGRTRAGGRRYDLLRESRIEDFALTDSHASRGSVSKRHLGV